MLIILSVSAAESRLLNISSIEFSLGEYFAHICKVTETFVQKAFHLQDKCFPLQ